ncbi:MAG: RNA-binding domain-containing protein [Candidatus Njordarchaeia archaeon]
MTRSKKILDLIKYGESETTEFKVSFTNMDEILKTICAFANGKGGYLFVGVKDDGKIVGVKIVRRVIDKLENSVCENIEPRIYIDISILAVDQKNVVLIKVPEGINKPYFYRGRCYIRIGSVTRQVGRDGIIKILKSKISFDNIRLEEDVNIRDEIVLELVERAKEHRRMRIESKNVDDILKKLGVYKKRAMALLFSDDMVFPQASIKCAAFKGKTVIDEESIYGPLFEQVKKALDFIKRNIKKGYKIEGELRKEIWEYPIEVLREAVVNAVVHRDYFMTAPIYIKIHGDKIVIQNPGELPPPLTVEMLKTEHPSIPRNPLIAEAFYLWGYIEKWGEGTIRMIEICRNHGLLEPKFVSEHGFFTVTIMKKEALIASLSEEIKKLYLYIKSRGTVTYRECVEFTGKSEKTTHRYLKKLLELGLINKTGKGRYSTI